MNSLLSPNIKLERNPEQIFSEIDGEIVMLSIENGEYYFLNEVGSYIWNVIFNPINYLDLLKILVKSYSIDFDDCDSDTRKFIYEMVENGVILLNDGEDK